MALVPHAATRYNANDMTRTRGFFRYYGGKHNLAPWIVSHMPAHRTYCEPFCGGARVLFAKPRSAVEVINDLDGGVVAAFTAARDDPAALSAMLRLTPYSRAEHAECVQSMRCLATCETDTLEAARRFLVVASQTMFSGSNPNNSWRRPLGGSESDAGAWARLPEVVWGVAERLRDVYVECRPAIEVI